MTFPVINDYKNAIRNAAGRFATLDATPQAGPDGAPIFLAGNFAGVFKLTGGDGRTIAVKCFIRDLPDLARRQRALVRFIRKVRRSYLVDMDFLPDEIFVRSSISAHKDYPVVVMPWIEGKPIGSVVARFCAQDNRKGLAALTRAWGHLCLDMLELGIAHGDLKHDNVLITAEGQLKLIDYDSMYLPELKGLPSTLLGGVNYQHPKRHVRHFDQRIDHFSMLVVALSLRALVFDPALHAAFHTGENLIFTHGDFVDPEASELLGRLRQSPDALVSDWAIRLIKACLGDSIEISAINRAMKRAQSAGIEIEKGGFLAMFSR